MSALLEKVPNQFEHYKEDEEAQHPTVAKVLSLLYFVAVVVTVVVLALYYALDPTNVTLTVPATPLLNSAGVGKPLPPTFEEVSTFIADSTNPALTCVCTNNNITIRSLLPATPYQIAFDSSCEAAGMGPFMSYDDYLELNETCPPDDAKGVCTGEPVMPLLFSAISELCRSRNGSLTFVMNSILTSVVNTPTLIDWRLLQNDYQARVAAASQAAQAMFRDAFRSLQILEHSYFPMKRFNVNKTNFGMVYSVVDEPEIAVLPRAVELQLRKSGFYSLPSSCGKVWDQSCDPVINALIGFQFTYSFIYEQIGKNATFSPRTTSFWDKLLNGTHTNSNYFDMFIVDAPINTSDITPQRYFEQCNVQDPCTYVKRQRRPTYDVLQSVFGVFGGATAAYQIIFGLCDKAFSARHQRKKRASSSSSSGSSTAAEAAAAQQKESDTVAAPASREELDSARA